MHLSSLEVRWFWAGGLQKHPGLTPVFEGSISVEKRSDVQGVRWSKPREDVYLIIPSADDLGIKWREGELQTKGRRALLGNMLFGDRIRGLVEQWTKWSHEGPVVDASLKPVFSSGDMKTAITVWKRRAIRKVRLDPFGESQEVPESEHIDRGVNCELTDLKVNGTLYCSLAFEAFPDDSEMPEQFTRLVTGFLIGFDPTAFDDAESKSYPAWLDQLARGVSAGPVT
jgi:hypothetical protein